MAWGEKQAGGVISNPILLYTQRLAHSQMPGFWDDEALPAAAAAADFTAAQAAIANIVADQCPGGDRQRKEEDEDSDDEDEGEGHAATAAPGRERVCCGDETEIPGYCFQPEYLHLRLRHHYPAVSFFVHQVGEDERGGPAQLRKLAV